MAVGADTTAYMPGDRNVAAGNVRVDVFRKLTGSVSDTLTLTRTGAAGLNLRHVGGGLTERVDSTIADATLTTNAFTFGVRTPDADLPRTGTATFGVGLVGSSARGGPPIDAASATPPFRVTGSGLLTLDFASGQWSSSVIADARIVTSPNTVPIQRPGLLTASGTLASAANSLSGTYSLQIQTALQGQAGTAAGLLYGPGASEVGLTLGGSDTSSNSSFLGVLVGARGTVAPPAETVTSLYGPITLAGNDASIRYGDAATPGFSDRFAQGRFQVGIILDAAIDPAASTITFSDGRVLSADNRTTGQSDARFTSYSVNGANFQAVHRVYNNGSGNDELVLSYMTFQLIDTRSEGVRGENSGYWGLRTFEGNLPRTGTATYQGVVYGSAIGTSDTADRYDLKGTAGFTFDWTAQTFTGSMAPDITNARTGEVARLDGLSFTDGRVTSGVFLDQFNAGIGGRTGTTGTVRGAFYGPTGQEIGATFNMTTPAFGTTVLGQGVIAAKRQ